MKLIEALWTIDAWPNVTEAAYIEAYDKLEKAIKQLEPDDEPAPSE